MHMNYLPVAIALVAVLATTAFAQTSAYRRHYVAVRKGEQQARIPQDRHALAHPRNQESRGSYRQKRDAQAGSGVALRKI